MGDGSTPFLHALSAELREPRSIASYEDNPIYATAFDPLRMPWHETHCVESYDEVPVRACGLLFVDHAPAKRRIVDMERFAELAQCMVVHDWNRYCYHYDKVKPLFRHQIVDKSLLPHTAILSNHIDVTTWAPPATPPTSP